jgi:hypothetical protein
MRFPLSSGLGGSRMAIRSRTAIATPPFIPSCYSAFVPLPQYVEGDIQAQIGALRAGRDEMLRLAGKYGADVVKQACARSSTTPNA